MAILAIARLVIKAANVAGAIKHIFHYTNCDMGTVFILLRIYTAVDFSLTCTISNTTGGGVRLQQRCPLIRGFYSLFY